MKPFRIHIGYTATGRNRWRYFDTLEAAKVSLERVFAETGIVLCLSTTTKSTTIAEEKPS